MDLSSEEKRRAKFQELVDNREWQKLDKFRTKLIQLAHFNQDGKCYFCRVEMVIDTNKEHHPDKMTREHLIPKSRGGSWNENPALSCYMCNHSKGQLDEREFIESTKFSNILGQRAKQGVYGSDYMNRPGRRTIRELIISQLLEAIDDGSDTSTGIG